MTGIRKLLSYREIMGTEIICPARWETGWGSLMPSIFLTGITG